MDAADKDRDRLAMLCEQRLVDRYEDHQRPSASARLQRELAIVGQLGRSQECLVASKVRHLARREGIALQMTGAACGSIILYLLGVSDVEPLGCGLLFERFFDPQGRWTTPFEIEVEAGYKERFEDSVRQHLSRQFTDRFRFQEAGDALVVLSRIAHQIRDTGSPYFDLDRIPLNDSAAYGVFRGADSFQTLPFVDEEVLLMLAVCQPVSISDIAMVVTEVFLGSKCGCLFESEEADPSALHLAVLKVLDETQHNIYYQEQIMVLLSELGGLNLSDAYDFIKATADQDWTALDGYREKFVEDARQLDHETAVDVVNWLEDAARYASCKAHDVSQAMRLYQAAYLKSHYPIEFNGVVQAVMTGL